MAKTMSPSTANPITAGQIGKLQELLGAALRKSGLQSSPTQQVLESQGGVLADEFVAVVRKRVEAMSNMIVRHVRVNRFRSHQEMLDATGRRQYTDKDVIATMPKGEGEEVDVYFFKLGRYVSVGDLVKEYELRGLKPDPYAQAAVNEADPAFANEHPNGSQWQNAHVNFCCVAFSHWCDERRVDVYRNGSGWRDDWWFSGVRNLDALKLGL